MVVASLPTIGFGKFKARLHFGSGEVKPVQRQRQTVPSVALHQPVSESKPIKVTVEDNGLGVCGFWVGVVSAVAGVIQVVTYFVH